MAVVATATSRRIVPLPTEYLPIEPAGEGFALDLRFPSEGASSGRDGSLHVGLHQCQIRRQEVEALLAVEEIVQPLGQRGSDPGGLLDRVGELGGVSGGDADHGDVRSEEHTSELKSLMRISYAVFCLKKKNTKQVQRHITP